MINRKKHSSRSSSSPSLQLLENAIESLRITPKTVNCFIPLRMFPSSLSLLGLFDRPILRRVLIIHFSSLGIEHSCKPFFVIQDEWREFQGINPLANQEKRKSRSSTGLAQQMHRFNPRKSITSTFLPTKFNETPIKSDETPIKSDETPIKSDETPTKPQPSFSSSASTSTQVHHFIPNLEDYDFFDYVNLYFHREKTRFFHHSSVAELGSFSAKIPVHSLQYVDRSRVPDVLEMERWVLAILGCYKDDISEKDTVEFGHLSKKDELRLQYILFKLCSMREVVDEIVCYLIKQSIDCPDSLCELKLYEVLFVVVNCLHPTNHLFNYLVNHLHSKIYDEDEVFFPLLLHA